MVGYCIYLLLPLYWLAILRCRATLILLASLLAAGKSHLGQFHEIWRNPVWFSAFVNSLNYVVLNTLISILVAVPAAYVFSRYRFLGDRQLFFWLLTTAWRWAVFLLPFFQLYSAVGLFDTPLAVALAHCLFTVPLSVWILEGFMSGVPTELDDMARIDGHSFSFFFLRIFVPVNRGAIGVTLFFCFMFSWVELLLARTLTGSEAKPIVVTMTHGKRLRFRLGRAGSSRCSR